MKKATKIITLYKYEELSKEIQEIIKENYLHYNTDILVQDFEFCCSENLNTRFPNSDIKISFDLSYRQGDYFAFYGDISLTDFLNDIINHENYRILFNEKELEWLKNFFGNYYDYYSIPNPEIRFYNSHNFLENVDFYEYDENSDDFFNKTLDKFNEICNRIYDDICSSYYDAGYNWLYEISDTDMSDISEANDWYYDDLGELHLLEEFSEITDC